MDGFNVGCDRKWMRKRGEAERNWTKSSTPHRDLSICVFFVICLVIYRFRIPFVLVFFSNHPFCSYYRGITFALVFLLLPA